MDGTAEGSGFGVEVLSALQKRFELTHHFSAGERKEIERLQTPEAFAEFCLRTARPELAGLRDATQIAHQLTDLRSLRGHEAAAEDSGWWLWGFDLWWLLVEWIFAKLLLQGTFGHREKIRLRMVTRLQEAGALVPASLLRPVRR